MPQLDVVTFVGQYMGTLVLLFFLLFLLEIEILPRLQQQLGLRVWAEEGLIVSNVGDEKINRKELVEVFKILCNQ